MKKLIYTLCCLLGLASFAACEKDMPAYEGKDGLYFDVQYTTVPHFTNPDMWAHQLYTWVRFVSMPENATDTTLSLKVNAVGEARDYDRVFNVAVGADSTTAVADQEYKDLSEQCVIKAGETSGLVNVTILRSDRVAEETVQLQLTLVPNEYFDLPFTYITEIPGRYTEGMTDFYNNPDPRVHNIFISDIMTQPTIWPLNFGEFSREKMELILRLYPDVPYDAFSALVTVPFIMQNIINEIVSNYLVEQFRAGNPITDADGTLMWFSNVPWEESSMPGDVVLD